MRRYCSTFLFTCFAFHLCLSQYTINTGGTISTCAGTSYDSGGAAGNYVGNEDYTQTFCSDVGSCTQLSFTSFSLGAGDALYIYDGPSTASTLVGTYTTNPGTIEATTGCLTIRFTSNNGGSNSSGWAATIACVACPEYILNGSAQYITVSGESCIQLTGEVNDQTGCAWNSTQIDFNSSFSLSLNYYFGNNINGADGSTFTFQPSSSTSCGTTGGQLGAGSIANSLVIEFDTYDNDNPVHAVDIAADHIAIEVDGDLQNSTHLAGPVAALSSGANIDDGVTRNVEIVWDAATQTLEVYFDGVLRLSTTYDFVTNVFGGDNTVYWGATAATGGLNNQQYFCPSSVLLPVELLSFDSECREGAEMIYWSTATELKTDYFQIEYTYDGMIYYPVGKIEAAGTSTELMEYSFSISHQDRRQRYYRLKMVDIDGEFKLTDLISSKNCNPAINLITQLKNGNSQLSIQTSEDSDFSVINELGQVVFQGMQTANKETAYQLSLSAGIYFIHVKGLFSSNTEIRKVYFNQNS